MKRYIAGIVALSAIVLVPIHQADAYNPLMSQSRYELRWQQQTVSFYLNPDGFQDFDPAQLEKLVRQCSHTWETINFGLHFEYKGLTDIKAADDDDVNVIYFEQNTQSWDNQFPTQERALAMTRVWSDTKGGIQGFDMVFNDGKYGFSNTLDPALWGYDFLNTCTHEMGHVLGLDHSEVSEATMAATAAVGDLSKRDLDADDVDGIKYLYRTGFQADSDIAGCNIVNTDVGRHPLPLGTLSLMLPLIWWVNRKDKREDT